MDRKEIEEQLKGWMEPEDLHPDLVPYLQRISLGQVIRHPLVYSVPHHPAMNKHINGHYLYKKERIKKAKEEKDWYLVIGLYERPYRMSAFQKISPFITDQKEYSELLAYVWIDSDNIWQYYSMWIGIWKECSDTYHVMDEDERDALHALPETITVYRGVTKAAHKKGLSWTLDQDKATWFSKRYAKPRDIPIVMSGEVKKNDVLAHFLGRNEKEIVVFYDKVKKRRVIPNQEY